MNAIHGTMIKPQDLKKEGNNYTFFKQLEGKKQPLKRPLNESIFTAFESLLITPEDEIIGVNGDKQEDLGKIKDAYAEAQQLFVAG
jgi:hypothetical protein